MVPWWYPVLGGFRLNHRKVVMLAFSSLPLALYIHVPWCIKKCPYCDFNSHAATQEAIDEDAYIDALLLDLESDLPKVWGRRVHCVFIGGGTPSMLSAKAYKKLFSGIRARIQLTANCEITLEANPSTFESDKFSGYRQAGINRLSIGVQSFDNEKLQALGRVHDADEAYKAIEIAKKAGFENINLDLMFALPNQSLEQAMDDLKTAIAFDTTHLSWYQLTMEPNTLFHHSPPPLLPDDDLIVDMMKKGKKLLAVHDFNQYEISAYSRKNQQCQHNLNYWTFGDYLGIGAGAHSKISDVNEQKVIRQSRYRLPEKYVTSVDKVNTVNVLNTQDLIVEYMMNHLRIDQGVDAEGLFMATGLVLDNYRNIINDGIKKGLLVERAKKIFTTEHGKYFLNDIVEMFS